MATIFEFGPPIFPSKTADSDSDVEEYEVNVAAVSQKMSFDSGGEEDSNQESGKMASLLPKNGVLFNHADMAPAPSKDYCQILVTLNEVIFRIWRISIRKNAKVAPGEIKDTHDDFLYDDRIQSEIRRAFGKGVFDYVHRICEGHIDYLPRLPRNCLVHVIRFLELEDVSRLAQVSKQFRDLCSADDLWNRIYEDHSGTTITDELRSLAEALGWRKLFFTNKLQLQCHSTDQISATTSLHE